MSKNDKRIYGIDAFRCLAAFLVVMVHAVNPNYIWKSIPSESLVEFVMHFFWLFSLCCVNCFAIITGYIGGPKKRRFASYFVLYSQVLFYLILIFVTRKFINIQCEPFLIRKCFPVTGGYFWYFTAYTGLIVFLPLLQKVSEKLSKYEFKTLLAGCFLVFVLSSIIPWGISDFIGVGYGFSVIWLIIMYLFGAYIRRFPPHSEKVYSIALIGSVFLPILGCLCYRYYYLIEGYGGVAYIIKSVFSVALYDVRDNEWALMYYNHPLVFAETICLLLIFSRLKLYVVGPWFRRLATCAFGVYLAHCNDIFKHLCSQPLIDWAQTKTGLFYPFAFLIIILFTFIFCSFIDFLREKIFIYSGVTCLIKIIGNRVELLWIKICRKSRNT